MKIFIAYCLRPVHTGECRRIRPNSAIVAASGDSCRIQQPVRTGLYERFVWTDVCLYRDVFPSSRCLFMYRDIVDTSKSIYRLSMVNPSWHLQYLLARFSSCVSKSLSYPLRSDLCMRFDNDLMFGVLASAVKIGSYLDLRRRGLDISALRYEDLVARPLDMCRVVLEFCHLPVSLAELAVKAFDVDSQANSVVAISAIGNIKEPQLTPQIKTKLNEILEKCGVPLIGEPGIIEGTLSCC